MIFLLIVWDNDSLPVSVHINHSLKYMYFAFAKLSGPNKAQF